jgi:hypothetical protein
MTRGSVFACVPVDTTGLPTFPVPIPVPSIEHTIKHCDGCTQQIWVGPSQLQAYEIHGGVLLCFVCALILYRRLEALGEPIGLEVLDPNADDVPRRT